LFSARVFSDCSELSQRLEESDDPNYESHPYHRDQQAIQPRVPILPSSPEKHRLLTRVVREATPSITNNKLLIETDLGTTARRRTSKIFLLRRRPSTVSSFRTGRSLD
jgi:hypothetical protein